jgi:hypothetical protein
MNTPPAPKAHDIPDEVIEEIAERAATKAVAKITDQIYKDVGKTVVQKFIWTVGAIAVAGFLWVSKIKGGS